jgi:DNA primase
MRRAIGLLLQSPELASEIPLQPELAQMNVPGISLFIKLQQLALERQLTTAQLLEQFRDGKEYAPLAKLAVWEHQVDADSLVDEFKSTFNFIEDQCLNLRLEALLIKDKTQGLSKAEWQEYSLLTQALKGR